MRAKFIYEVNFERGQNPLDAMNIGSLYSIHKFENQDDVINWIIKHLPQILKTKEIPEDIIVSQGYYINDLYINKIEYYINKYTVLEKDKYTTFSFSWNRLYRTLKERGYKD